MSNQPTVIVLGHMLRNSSHASHVADGPMAFGALQVTLLRVLASELPVVLVASSEVLNQASSLIPGNCMVELPWSARHNMAMAVPPGVHASAQAAGWLLVPADMPMLQTNTLKVVAQALQTHPIACPRYAGRRGHPMGFGKELFSELIRLDHNRSLSRLTSRYPTEELDVCDPGVILSAHMAAERLPLEQVSLPTLRKQ